MVSDFHQWYDCIFDRDGPVLNRIANDLGPAALGKLGQLRAIQDRGWEAINWRDHYGGRIPEDFEYPIIVHTDPYAHCGEGKVLVKDRQAYLDGFDRYYCKPYTHVLGQLGHSWRRLQIGRKVWWLEYVSKDDWRSNCGDTSCEVIGTEESPLNPMYPMHAIDFALCDELIGVDFNTAPGVPRGLCEASVILNQLEGWFKCELK